MIRDSTPAEKERKDFGLVKHYLKSKTAFSKGRTLKRDRRLEKKKKLVRDPENSKGKRPSEHVLHKNQRQPDMRMKLKSANGPGGELSEKNLKEHQSVEGRKKFPDDRHKMIHTGNKLRAAERPTGGGKRNERSVPRGTRVPKKRKRRSATYYLGQCIGRERGVGFVEP